MSLKKLVSSLAVSSLAVSGLLLSVAVLGPAPALHAQAVSIAALTGRVTAPALKCRVPNNISSATIPPLSGPTHIGLAERR